MISEETKQVLRLSLTEFSLPKFYLLFGISKVKSAAVIAFRSSYRDRSFSPGSYERETFALSSLETVTEALLEIMEVSRESLFHVGNPSELGDTIGNVIIKNMFVSCDNNICYNIFSLLNA